MILLQDIVKRFGDITALDHVNLEIKKGSICGLLGPNGAGKSTLLRLLCGVFRPDEGVLTVSGKEVFERPEQKQRVFFVADEPYFLPQATLDTMARLAWSCSVRNTGIWTQSKSFKWAQNAAHRF